MVLTMVLPFVTMNEAQAGYKKGKSEKQTDKL